MRSLKSFWSRDSVADRVDGAIAVLAAQLEKGLSGVRGDVQRIGERCDAIAGDVQAMTGYGDRILATAESMRGIEAAIPGLVSTTNTLVDIGMTQIHQTAIFQRTLEEGLLARPDLDESEPDDATPGTDVVDATDSAAARLAPAERQILDNFARALQTFVS